MSFARKTSRSARATRRICVTALALVLPSAVLADVSSLEQADTTVDAGLPREANGQTAEVLSAFFGLDDTMPSQANRICRGGAGLDGMPVIFSTEIDHTTLQAGDFRVTTRSGRLGSLLCASFLPATDAGELRTVLLIGDFGDANSDPPASVEIVGHLYSLDGSLDYQGASVVVTPLESGPTLVMAERFSPEVPDEGLGRRRTTGSACPEASIRQAVRVVWAGGVTPVDGSEPELEMSALYQVTVQSDDGARRVITPVALADLGDNDNKHLLCLETSDTPLSVSFPAGFLADPNGDVNPATTVQVNTR